MIDLRLGDCIEVLKTLEDNSVDSIVTDPPYGIGFMNKEWDNPQKHKELIEREAKRSEQRFEEGKSPAKGGFSKGVQPGLPIGGAKEGRWFQEWCEEWAAECFRVLKPGGHILSFSAPRTYHRMATAFEEVGFQVRDQIMWVFGSGFPKSHNIGKAIDKIAGRVDLSCDEVKLKIKELYDKSGKSLSKITEECGFNASGYIKTESNKPDPWTKTLPTIEKWEVISKVINATEEEKNEISNLLQSAEREVIGKKSSGLFNGGEGNSVGGTIVAEVDITIANIDEAKKWEGWGTALKPAHEPICMARKPLSEKSIAENVLKHGTGGINIDDCRIGSEVRTTPIHSDDVKDDTTMFGLHKTIQHHREETTEGRFPANIMFDEEAGKILDEQSGISSSGKNKIRTSDGFSDNIYGKGIGVKTGENNGEYGDKGGASRFFYCPKVSKKERNAGLEDMEDRPSQLNSGGIGRKTSVEKRLETNGENAPTTKNHHPTVKPIALMEYLIKLVTPKGGVVLEPFMGSGSTGIAAKNLGMSFIGIEKEEEYMEIAKRRIENYEV